MIKLISASYGFFRWGNVELNWNMSEFALPLSFGFDGTLIDFRFLCAGITIQI
jgi:hypothetical protein